MNTFDNNIGDGCVMLCQNNRTAPNGRSWEPCSLFQLFVLVLRCIYFMVQSLMSQYSHFKQKQVPDFGKQAVVNPL